jgi:hypothetical protein
MKLLVVSFQLLCKSNYFEIRFIATTQKKVGDVAKCLSTSNPGLSPVLPKEREREERDRERETERERQRERDRERDRETEIETETEKQFSNIPSTNKILTLDRPQRSRKKVFSW